jgi:multicomponent Na+:H+ antiporter subunit E
MMRAAIPRWLGFFAFWLVLSLGASGGLPFGVVAATAATWISLRLVPADGYDIRWGALLRFLPHFLWQSVVAGVDVARRAFDPRMPLRPGFVSYPIGFRSATARNTFTTITSLLPGTVPCGVKDSQLVYHCLDIGRPVAAELAAEEQRLATVIDEAPHV